VKREEAASSSLRHKRRAVGQRFFGLGCGHNARLLDGFEVREGRYLLDGAELKVRYFDNAAD
jgi:hypothetical protein